MKHQESHLCEISVVDLVGVHTCHRHLGGSGDGESLVHAAEGHTVDLERTGDKKEARGKLLEKYHALTPETSCEEDKHSSRGDGCTELGGLGHVAAREGNRDVL